MDRRETIKLLLFTSIAGNTLFLAGCKKNGVENTVRAVYGRTPEELEYDEEIYNRTFLNKHELETVAILADIILPADEKSGSATEAGVVEFIEFIVKEMEGHQEVMRNGLAYLDNESNSRFSSEFKLAELENQKAILDEIAYPEYEESRKDAVSFFSLLRNLVVTGFYTSKMGFDDLGYKGNTPNVWDGVPPEVLAEYDVDYDEEWLAKCIDQSKRNDMAKWDDNKNLIS